jgi:hypothetical protein
MSFIEITCDKNFIYVAIYWIIEIAFRFFSKIEKELFTIFAEDKVLDEYAIQIKKIAGDLLAGFLVLYSHCSSKSKKVKENVEYDDKIYYIYEEPQMVPKKKKIKIMIIGILEYLCQTCYWISYAIIGDKTKISYSIENDSTYIIDILMRYVFSIIILKIMIYKHHKFSLVIISLGFLFLLVADIIDLTFKNDKVSLGHSFLLALICLPKSFASPYEHVLIKQTLIYINQENIQFLRGILSLIILIIISIILYFPFRETLNPNLKPNFSVKTIIGAIIYILIRGTKEFILLKVIDKISLQSVSFLIIAKYIGFNIYGIYTKFSENKDQDDFFLILLHIVGTFIILIACLIYDEVIIINKWNLDYFTKKRINERAEEEANDENNDEDALFPTITQKIEIEEITNKILKN